MLPAAAAQDEGKDDPGISDDPLNEPTNDDPDHPVD